jgi:hypothetical protein
MDVFNQLKQTAKDIMPKQTIENNRKILRTELNQSIQLNQGKKDDAKGGQDLIQSHNHNSLNGNSVEKQSEAIQEVAKEPEVEQQKAMVEDDDSDLEITEVR